MATRWQRTEPPRGEEYDARWEPLAEAGQNVHGEADLVEFLLAGNGGCTVLDAGCGTGRVAIELARRGITVTGVDADADMLATARAKAPLDWQLADLAALDGASGGPFDLVLLAGNVMIFVEPGTEGGVLANLAGLLRPGGVLVAGFSLQPDLLSCARYDDLAAAAGLHLMSRWATWDRQPFAGGDYAVSVHRLGR
jgi:SAM-dependent methyltransferase